MLAVILSAICLSLGIYIGYKYGKSVVDVAKSDVAEVKQDISKI